MDNNNKGIVKGAILEGTVEAFVISLIHSFGTAVKDQSIDYLKANVFGIGTADEHLFLSACTYAIENRMITPDQLVRVCKVIDQCDTSKVRLVIGKEESEVSIETPKIDDAGQFVKEKKTGKTVMVKTTSKANIKGAEMLKMFAQMDEDEIKVVLNTSGASRGMMSNVLKTTNTIVATASAAVNNSTLKNDGDTFFKRETWLEKKLREKKGN